MYAIKIFCLILFLPIYCFASLPVNPAKKTTVYRIEESLRPDVLTVYVDRHHEHLATKLILSASSMTEQVQNLSCDGEALKKDKPGVWSVPANCKKIQWQVPLFESRLTLASDQQSIKYGNFILFSEASSLPRLKDATGTEMIRISIKNVNIIFPVFNEDGEIPLPPKNSAPFFLLLNPAVVDTYFSENIRLRYFLDNPEAISRLPDMSSHMKGLQWLNSIIPGKSREDFTLAWFGIPAKRASLAGAAGHQILLANYPDDEDFPFGQTMLLYVGLHEAFHQFAMNYSPQPAWISESLASYYGIRALQTATPEDPKISALLELFLIGANHFQDGLLTINRKVEADNRTEYGAFYTKGIAFWLAVDNALQKQADSLDNHLLTLLQTKYNEQTNLKDLQKNLQLPAEIWDSLYHQFLD